MGEPRIMGAPRKPPRPPPPRGMNPPPGAIWSALGVAFFTSTSFPPSICFGFLSRSLSDDSFSNVMKQKPLRRFWI
jgi:hypothetical protein